MKIADPGVPRVPSGASLSPEELRRYGRHLLLPEVGLRGQLRLKAAKVLVAGAGGLGSPAALYLAAAGVGTIGLADFDSVELSNLQRQVLFSTEDVGRPKVEAGKERLAGLNPGVKLKVHSSRLTAGNALGVVGAYDVVVDGTDNFPARYLLNDACVLAGKPCVSAAVTAFEGRLTVFSPGGPCLRCLWPAPPPAGSVPSCAQAGVLGVLPGILGSLQALEALKLVLGIGRPLKGRILVFDGLGSGFRELAARRNPACPACGSRPSIPPLRDEPQACENRYNGRSGGPMTMTEGKETLFTRLYKTAHGVQGVPETSPEDLKKLLDAKEDLLLLDVRQPVEWDIVHIAGATLIPMGELSQRLGELDKARPTVVYCHTGGRSARVTAFLLKQGFEKVLNLKGGIDAWAERVDPSLPTY